MNQSTPPANPYAQPAGDHGDANPYLNQRESSSQPDLDAAAPTLRTEEQQRLNRKALGFLAGIIGLLLLMAWWVFGSAGEEPKAAPQLQAVEEVPTAPGEADLPLPVGVADPIALEPYDSTPSGNDMPPLPQAPPPTSYPSSGGYGDSQASMPPPPAPPTLLERRMGMVQQDPAAVGAGMDGAGPDGAAGANAVQVAASGRSDGTSARFLRNPDSLLVRGTYLRCVLETRIITDVAGFTSCIVTEPVYSINGRKLLLPKGSKILGSYQGEPTGPRVSVVWDRITTPNGIDVSMSSPGIDNLGGAGHPGHYSAHWPQRIASALLISVIADAFKYAAAENGPPTAALGGSGVIVQQPYESATARTMERLANEAMIKSGRRPATVTINQGSVVNVYVAKDVDFSAVVGRR